MMQCCYAQASSYHSGVKFDHDRGHSCSDGNNLNTAVRRSPRNVLVRAHHRYSAIFGPGVLEENFIITNLNHGVCVDPCAQMTASRKCLCHFWWQGLGRRRSSLEL